MSNGDRLKTERDENFQVIQTICKTLYDPDCEHGCDEGLDYEGDEWGPCGCIYRRRESELPIPAEAVSVMYDSLARSALKDVATVIAGLRAEDRPKYENAIKGIAEDAFREGLAAMSGEKDTRVYDRHGAPYVWTLSKPDLRGNRTTLDHHGEGTIRVVPKSALSAVEAERDEWKTQHRYAMEGQQSWKHTAERNLERAERAEAALAEAIDLLEEVPLPWDGLEAFLRKHIDTSRTRGGVSVSDTHDRLARKIHECDKQMERLRGERYDCVKAWERATGRRWMPGPPTAPEPPDERPVS